MEQPLLVPWALLILVVQPSPFPCLQENFQVLQQPLDADLCISLGAAGSELPAARWAGSHQAALGMAQPAGRAVGNIWDRDIGILGLQGLS